VTDVVVIAPHADDETLGCGGTLLRHAASGDKIHWILVTSMSANRFSENRIAARRAEIDAVREAYSFSSVYELDFPTAQLDSIATSDLVARIGKAILDIGPEIVYLPFPGDVHTDHRVVFMAAAATTKWFRYPSVKKVLACEIPSETDFGISPDVIGFRPNLYVDITPWLDRKIEILSTYDGELLMHPFPRSIAGVRALALIRGAQSGCVAAEAFMVIKEVIR
jgi:LmbE family N-acetylglucosaminyl deacetylase